MAKIAESLEIAIDLGSDTVKVAYAFETKEGVEYGKLCPRDITGSVTVPALAYYDEDSSQWLFGENVYKCIDKSFVSVVKIKSLLSLLLKNGNRKVSESNKDFYFNRYSFPKFYFPNKRKLSEDFGEAVELDMTFEADRTPKQVCEEFFEYLIRQTVLPAVDRLKESRSTDFAEINYSLVYPNKAGKEYVDELQRLAEAACGVAMKRILSSTKALGLFAYHRGVIKKKEAIVIFDMGEEDISVAKMSLHTSGSIIIDGVDGHNEPMEIGGNDLDYAVRDYIESVISGRETVGAPSAGQDGYIAEKGLHSKQFLTLNEIKKTKTALSMDDDIFFDAFPDGVPMSIQRDVTVQTNVTRENFLISIGVENQDGVAKKISDYICKELKRRINVDVKKVMLSGGVTETYGLIEYIGRELKDAGIKAQVVTFDDYNSYDDGFNVLSNEDSTFAPAVGGAVVALMGYEVKTAVALSYGTWLYNKNICKKILDVFLERGKVIPQKGGEYYSSTYVNYRDSWSDCVKNEEIFSTTFGKKGDVIGEPGSDTRKKRAVDIDLKVVSGGKDRGKILFYHKDKGNMRRVEIQGLLYFQEGVKIDADGRATPFIRNDLTKNGKYNEILVRPVGAFGYPKKAYYNDIVLKFSGVEDFEVEGSD
ncbi:MAG: hypothetical protein OSJ74_06675 [Clostridia bacterium]|nr:hypothetical protein [Clostridia bacterium]